MIYHYANNRSICVYPDLHRKRFTLQQCSQQITSFSDFKLLSQYQSDNIKIIAKYTENKSSEPSDNLLARAFGLGCTRGCGIFPKHKRWSEHPALPQGYSCRTMQQNHSSFKCILSYQETQLPNRNWVEEQRNSSIKYSLFCETHSKACQTQVQFDTFQTTCFNILTSHCKLSNCD